MSTKTFKTDPCSVPVLAAWQIVVQALIDGEATRKELAWIERTFANLSLLAPWMAYRRHILETDPHGEAKELLKLGTDNVKKTQVWTRIIDSGFQAAVRKTPKRERRQAMRVIAGVLYAADVLQDLMRTLYSNGAVPSWIRRATAKETDLPEPGTPTGLPSERAATSVITNRLTVGAIRSLAIDPGVQQPT